MWDLRATVAPRRFLGARAVATPAESRAKQSTETGRARPGCWGEGDVSPVDQWPHQRNL